MRWALLLVALFLIGFAARPANAGCRWEWLCDAQGNCRQAPICESSIDLPPLRPPEIKPIVPPAIKPIASPTLPPLGTSECDQVRRCDSWGNCVWDTVCY